MHQLTIREVMPQIEAALVAHKTTEAAALLWPALNQHPHIAALWFYAGSLLNMEGKQAMAYQAWQRAYELEPNHIILANMGAALRAMQQAELGRDFLKRALEYAPSDPGILANLTGCYVNEGNPWPGIDYGTKALGTPHDSSARFNLALLCLEAGQFTPGFDYYAEGKHQHREERRYEPDVPLLTPELHEQLKGTGATIITWGEQGIGDELMFGTILNDAIKDYEIVFECHPRLELLHRTSSWARSLAKQGRPVQIHSTRKMKPIDLSDRPVAAKVAMGNLCRLYRRAKETFAWQGPTYQAPEREAQQMRAHLTELAEGRTIVGLAMRGGMIETNRGYRCLTPDRLMPLLQDESLFFVSLDYEDMTEVHDWISRHVPGDRYLWYPSVNFAWDYHHVASLVRATDCVVTVPQSVAHISAGMGHPTYLLTPSKPDWRLTCVTGEHWIWYDHPNVRLYRQNGNDWNPAILEVHRAVQAHFSKTEGVAL